MFTADYCTDFVQTVGPAATLVEAARLMRENHVGSLIVVEPDTAGDVPVGIVTDRDLVMTTLAEGGPPLTVADIIHGDVVTVRDGESVFDAIDLMRSHAVRRLPVVDEDGALVGVFTADDALGLLADQMASLAHMIRAQSNEEQERRPSRRARTYTPGVAPKHAPMR
jgi:predicted transcriptional regulator